ncbi:AraC family transcriptional regulator [Saccharibacillus sp. CPCC 101409]|uniref:AraC family transcriptional regulator n=1 Tax=Saccharibacillus sp. CPCC 101409 TaxID=3058041 RepID=UPI0026732B42|nr:AraC family transcriptional regulator [Saccharibacillus sp. CPCC 101409]MDO3409249.1 AraC family transcriptional regulator [Saccharibacillus sp. CPCC 101409]
MDELYFDNGKETFIVHHRKALSHRMTINHFHSTYEVFYLMAGKREFFIKDRAFVIEEGDLIIISPNVLHRTMDTEIPVHERLVVNIHESYITAPDGSRSDVLHPLFEQEYILVKGHLLKQVPVNGLAQEIVREVREKKPGYEAYARALTLQMLIVGCRKWAEAGGEPQLYPSPVHERISEVVRYINSHYMEELSLDLLAEKFYVSPYYISRSFKTATGFAFVEYLNIVRVKEATTLLLSSSLKVHVIAARVGFGSVTHFGRVFKQITGRPPLFYRKMQ